MIAEPAFQSLPVPSSPHVGWLNAHHATEKFHIQICDVGLGVFASRDFAPGENILAIEGPIIDFAETKRRGPRECMAIADHVWGLEEIVALIDAANNGVKPVENSK
jgi:hypothetical protein